MFVLNDCGYENQSIYQLLGSSEFTSVQGERLFYDLMIIHEQQE